MVSTVLATVGLVNLALRMPRAVHGAAPLPRRMQGTLDQELVRLRHAEALLRSDAVRSEERYFWLAHVANLLLNIGGAVVVGLGYDAWRRGIISAGIGIAIGEVILWSYPWQPARHWRAYRQRYTPLDLDARSR